VDEGGQLAATGCACSGSPACGVPATCPRARSCVGREFCRERSRRGRGGVQRVRPEDVETRVEAYGTVKLTNESLAFGAVNTADDQVDAAIEERNRTTIQRKRINPSPRRLTSSRPTILSPSSGRLTGRRPGRLGIALRRPTRGWEAARSWSPSSTREPTTTLISRRTSWTVRWAVVDTRASRVAGTRLTVHV
jgi:hypothetical protein